MTQAANNPSILGPTASIDAASAADVLAARIAALSSPPASPSASSTFYVGPEGASQDLRVAGLTSEDALNAILAENQAAAAGPQAAYEEARRIDSESLKQARGDYASLGLHDLAASNSPIFKDYAARVQQQARYNAGYADTPNLPIAPEPDLPEPKIGNGPTLFDSARHLDRLTEAELKEEWTAGGRYNEVGVSKSYKKELEERLQKSRYDAGYTSSPDTPIEHKESLKDILTGMDMSYAVAYGGMQAIGNEQKAFSPVLSGDAYLSDQVQEQATTGVLPLIGAVGGTLVGLKGGPAAGLAGQYIGQQAGASAEESLDAFFTGHKFTQERAGESLGVGRGGKDAADEFADALKNVVTPAAKELADVFTRLGQSGPVAASGVAGIAPFQSEFGTAFAGTVAGEDRFLSSSPFFAGLRQQFGTNAAGISGSDYLGAAGIGAFTNDYAGMQASLGFAQAKAGRDVENPAYRRDSDFVDRFRKTEGIGQDIKDFFTPDGGQGQAYQDAEVRLGYNAATEKNDMPGGEAQYLSRQDAAKAKQIADSAKIYTDAYEQHQKDEAGLLYSGAGVEEGVAGLQLSLRRGSGAAAYAQVQPSINASAAKAEGDVAKDISGLQKLESLSPDLAPYYETLIRQDKKRSLDFQGETAAIAQAGLAAQIEESESGYGRTRAQGRRALSSGLLSGRRYDELAGDEHGILSAEEAQASSLIRLAANPLNSPAQRNKLLMEASGLQQDAQEQQYAFKMAGYSQTLAGIDAQSADASLKVTQAQIGGGPSEVFAARSEEVSAFAAKIKALGDELAAGGLKADDRIAKERELTSTRQAQAQAVDSRNQAYFAGQSQITGTETETARVGLDRQMRRGGNAAFNPNILALDLSAETEAQNKLDFDRRATPGNAQRLASDALGVAQAKERTEESLDESNRYRPTGQFARKLAGDETDFRVAMEMPYADGNPENDPMTRGRGLLADYRQDLAQLGANRAAKQKAGKWRDEDETLYLGQQSDDRLKIAGVEAEERTGFLRFLPEMLAGSPGRGVMSGVLPTAGQSAYYNPNSYMNGTFSQPHPASDGSGHAASAGGVAGGFLSVHGGGGPESALMQAAQALKEAAQALRGTPGGSSPARPLPGSFQQMQNTALNGYKAGG